ncbi:MAG: phosphate ABC transporter substrate-binding protein [Candidatus Eremiobacteraeota bacterium]|nr:phosphate ABC transporter substrate-binding protein [Candidatus Eremiobacteraeota bacterium]MBV9737612.1 phosphate ABC transporter substrate-binding protein [Candidatus Eremiobacteraeota bacterium]
MLKFIAAIAMVAASALPLAARADTNLTIAGSTALLPLVKESAQSYQSSHSSVKISVSGGGSYVGISQAMSKSVDIGDSDVLAPGNSGLRDHKVAVVGFSVVVNPATGVTALSKKQIRDIFSGRVTNWKDVGGKDVAITVINRPRSSGTRAVFNATLMGASKIAEGGQVEDSSGQVVTTVGTLPGAVSYVAFAYAKGKNVNMVKIDHVAASDDNVQSGRYPFWSYEHMFTHSGSPREAEDFIGYVSRNKDTLEKLGYIPISNMKVAENNR